jgi:hypothetical protein
MIGGSDIPKRVGRSVRPCVLPVVDVVDVVDFVDYRLSAYPRTIRIQASPPRQGESTRGGLVWRPID